MSEIKHTPLIADAERVRLEDGTLIATVWQQYPSKERRPGESFLEMMKRTEPARDASKQQAIDRARLLAAAPELIEALRLCFEHCRLYHREIERNNVGKVVRAAIAKATGSQS